MGRFFRFLLYILGILIVLAVLAVSYFQVNYMVLNNRASSQLGAKSTLASESGFRFRDLNANGELDPYEDSRQDIETRVDDLLSQMTVEEKVGLMWHPPIGVGEEGEILNKPNIRRFNMASTFDNLVNKKINHFNLFIIPEPTYHAQWYNKVQEVAEQTRLGIPITISTDPRHGLTNFLDDSDMLSSQMSKWPEPLGFGAIGDSSAMIKFGQIANQEYRALGIRAALHPMADLATEPRWGRTNGTFSEDAELAAKLTAAYIYGFQGDSLNAESISCMTKHWPGGGPQKEGWDAHFSYGRDQAYPGDNFDYHLIPFESALEAGTAMIMPYYGIPLDQTSENVGMSFNREIIQGLLRNQYGYDGVVCTDWSVIQGIKLFGMELGGMYWGVDNLSVKERIQKVIEAGVDQFGGNNNTQDLLKLIEEKKVSEARIDESARRLLRVKFRLGLFDNPYVDVDQASVIVGNQQFKEAGEMAMRQSVVLLKNQMNADSSQVLPLKKGTKIYLEGISEPEARKYGEIVDDLHEADFAIVRIRAPWVVPEDAGFLESMFHQGDLDFKEPELSRLLEIANTKPTIFCLYLDRAAVIPELAKASVGLIADFGVSHSVLTDVIFGEFNPTGKLPIELPSAMKAVENQFEDVPYDSESPLFPFGHGLNYPQPDSSAMIINRNTL